MVPDLDVLRDWYTTRNAQTDRLDLAIVDRATGGAWERRCSTSGSRTTGR